MLVVNSVLGAEAVVTLQRSHITGRVPPIDAKLFDVFFHHLVDRALQRR